MNNMVCGRCSVSRIIQFKKCPFFKNIHIFRHLKLEIALAIPALNDEIQYNQLSRTRVNTTDGMQNDWITYHISCALYAVLNKTFTEYLDLFGFAYYKDISRIARGWGRGNQLPVLSDHSILSVWRGVYSSRLHIMIRIIKSYWCLSVIVSLVWFIYIIITLTCLILFFFEHWYMRVRWRYHLHKLFYIRTLARCLSVTELPHYGEYLQVDD